MSTRNAALAATLLLVVQAASASPFSDDLSRCLLSSTSQEDRIALARWVFIAFSAHPAVESISKVTNADIDSANGAIADLYTRLLTESCRSQAKAAIKYEGAASIQSSFRILGQAAGVELAGSPEVQARMTGFANKLDVKKLEELSKEP